MQIYAIGSAVLLLLASSSSVYARAIIYGWGERIVLVGDLPPDVRAQIRQETQQDVAIGFCYRYWYLFADGFDFWRWNGRYVVYGNNKYWNFTDDELLELIGPERYAALSSPVSYWLPPGLATVLTIVGLWVGWATLRPSDERRAKKLLKSAAYQEASQVYTKVLKSYPQRTQEDRNRAMASAVEVLKTIHGLSPQVAGANLRLVLAELDRQRSYDLRSLAVQYEMSGDWEQALQHYEQAASLRVERDDRDYQFLMKCIQRVRDKQARSART